MYYVCMYVCMHVCKYACMHVLRKILGITWMDKVSNQDVLRRANLPGVEALITKAQLRWSGHVMRMEDSRLPKQVFCSELTQTRGPAKTLQGLPEETPTCLQYPHSWMGKIVLPGDRKRKLGLQLLR